MSKSRKPKGKNGGEQTSRDVIREIFAKAKDAGFLKDLQLDEDDIIQDDLVEAMMAYD